MPDTKTEVFLSPGSVCDQQFIPDMTEWKKNLWNSLLTPGHSLKFQTYQNPLFSLQTNLGDMVT